jgi:hypothetical protein
MESRILSELRALGLASMDGAQAERFFGENVLIVYGSGLDSPESALMESAKLKYPAIGAAQSSGDSAEALAAVESGRYKLVVLLGGPSQNKVTREAVSKGWLAETQEAHGELVVAYGGVSGSRIIAVSDARGYANAGRDGAQYSPLALVLPVQYVPAAATLVSAFLLWLLGFAHNIFEGYVGDKAKEGKKVGEGAWTLFGINLRELASIPAAALVLSISISWQFFGLSPDFVLWIFANLLVCAFAFLVHDLTHRYFAMLFSIKVEYRLWYLGSLLTLVSSWLGNAFSVQSFTVEDVGPSTPKWQVGVMKLSAPLASLAVMLLFAGINALFPSTVFQMIFTASGLLAVSEMFPVRGTDGMDVWAWHPLIWLVSFAAIAVPYAFVTFLL